MTANIDGQESKPLSKRIPELGEETISVVLFADGGLKRSQQMFADLNQFAVRPSKGIGILYDLRSPMAQLARRIVKDVEVFSTLTEVERSSIPQKSIKLFTLSSVYQGTRSLLGKRKNDELSQGDGDLAVRFWCEVARQMPDWNLAAQRRVHSSELRRDFIHAHGIGLHALGIMGARLVREFPDDWPEKLSGLTGVDWNRRNSKVWEGRAHGLRTNQQGKYTHRPDCDSLKTSGWAGTEYRGSRSRSAGWRGDTMSNIVTEIRSASGLSKDALVLLHAEIREVYLSDVRPWVLGFSGGKDSTTALQLVWSALLELKPELRVKPVLRYLVGHACGNTDDGCLCRFDARDDERSRPKVGLP